MKLLFISILAAAIPALATAKTHRHHKAHSHDHSEAQVFYGDKELSIDLEAPMHSIVGFEHAAKSAKEKNAIKKAKSFWMTAAKVIEIKPAGLCKLIETDVDLGNEHDDHDHEKKHEKDHHHDDHGKHEKKHKKDHHHDKKHKSKEVHSELDAEYVFECTAKPKSVSLIAYKSYSLGKLKVRYQIESKQGSIELTKEKHEMVLP